MQTQPKLLKNYLRSPFPKGFVFPPLPLLEEPYGTSPIARTTVVPIPMLDMRDLAYVVSRSHSSYDCLKTIAFAKTNGVDVRSCFGL